MKVAFRVDASYQIATGHVIRCLTLANALRQRGVNCLFICRALEGNLNDVIRDEGYPLKELASDPDCSLPPPSSPHHAHWLETHWEIDAQQTSDILRAFSPDCLIVDHYALDIQWESRLRPFCPKIMVIDDLADRAHDCDLLLDQNPWPNMQERYARLVTASTRLLLGPRFALLREEFRELRENKTIQKKPQIIAFFSGTDATGECTKLLDALENRPLLNKSLRLILGRSNIQAKALLRRAANIDNMSAIISTPHIAQEMAESEYAIGCSGATSWERFCLGINATLIAAAENQIKPASYLESMHLIHFLGLANDITSEHYAKLLNKLDRADWPVCATEKIQELVDGKGVNRVIETLIKN